MKTRNFSIYRMIVTAALISLAAALPAAAGGQKVVVSIPFDFQAGETAFPAGVYSLSIDTSSRDSVVIRSAADGRGAVLLAHRSPRQNPHGTPNVNFKAYGETRFLTAIQTGDTYDRWEFTPSNLQSSLERDHEEGGTASLTAALAK